MNTIKFQISLKFWNILCLLFMFAGETSVIFLRDYMHKSEICQKV